MVVAFTARCHQVPTGVLIASWQRATLTPLRCARAFAGPRPAVCAVDRQHRRHDSGVARPRVAAWCGRAECNALAIRMEARGGRTGRLAGTQPPAIVTGRVAEGEHGQRAAAASRQLRQRGAVAARQHGRAVGHLPGTAVPGLLLAPRHHSGHEGRAAAAAHHAAHQLRPVAIATPLAAHLGDDVQAVAACPAAA